MNRREFLKHPIVWVVGCSMGGLRPWEIQGIYIDEQVALAAHNSIDWGAFLIGPLKLNVGDSQLQEEFNEPT